MSISLIVLVLGGIAYVAVKNNAELKEIGRLMFFAGLLAFLLQVGGHVLTPFR